MSELHMLEKLRLALKELTSLLGVQGVKPPEAPAILQYTVPKKMPPKNHFLGIFYLCAAYKLEGKIHLN